MYPASPTNFCPSVRIHARKARFPDELLPLRQYPRQKGPYVGLPGGRIFPQLTYFFLT